jgi:hypothetical protein
MPAAAGRTPAPDEVRRPPRRPPARPARPRHGACRTRPPTRTGTCNVHAGRRRRPRDAPGRRWCRRPSPSPSSHRPRPGAPDPPLRNPACPRSNDRPSASIRTERSLTSTTTTADHPATARRPPRSAGQRPPSTAPRDRRPGQLPATGTARARRPPPDARHDARPDQPDPDTPVAGRHLIRVPNVRGGNRFKNTTATAAPPRAGSSGTPGLGSLGAYVEAQYLPACS